MSEQSKTTNARPIMLWHGGRLPENLTEIEIRPSRSGRAEHGPGLYLTTSIDIASRYAKGGNSLYRVSVNPDLNLVEDIRLPVEDIVKMAEGIRGLKDKASIVEYIRKSSERNNGKPSLSMLIILCVNHDSITPNVGRDLAEILADAGADASLSTSASKDHLIVFNPKIITEVEKLRSDQINWAVADFDPVRTQIANSYTMPAAEASEQKEAASERQTL